MTCHSSDSLLKDAAVIEALDVTPIKKLVSAGVLGCKNDISLYTINVGRIQYMRSSSPRSALVALSDARPTGDMEVAGSIPTGSGNILSWSLIMK